MDEETLAVAGLESLQRTAAQSKIGAVMNSPEKHEAGKKQKSYKNIAEDNQKILNETGGVCHFSIIDLHCPINTF